jgi:RNA recognition motif-containing protein
MTQQELESMFADFGCIISSKILCNPKAGRQQMYTRARMHRIRINFDKQSSSHLFVNIDLCSFVKHAHLSFKGASKSVGFIRFDQRSEAESAISKLNGTIPKGNRMFIVIHR